MSRQHLYTGKSGQLAVMAEFLSRGYNVAVPEVDLGDDMFVVRDRDGQLSRVQVKAANAKELPGGAWGAVFKLSLRQLEQPQIPDMNYVLTVRHQERWRDFIIIDRMELRRRHAVYGLGKVLEGSVILSFVFSAADALCKDQSFEAFRNDWSRWPAIDHRGPPSSSPPDAPLEAED
jgi:hypothetical protein